MCNDHTTFTPPQAFSPVFVFCFAQNSYFTSRARQDTKYKCIWLTLSTYCPSRLTRKRGGALLQIYSNSDILRIMEYPSLIRPTSLPAASGWSCSIYCQTPALLDTEDGLQSLKGRMWSVPEDFCSMCGDSKLQN